MGLAKALHGAPTKEVAAALQVDDQSEFSVRLSATKSSRPIRSGKFNVNPVGLGIDGGKSDQVDGGEAVLIQFDQDVSIESASIIAGDGACGGFYRVGDQAPLAIYCIDADIDAQDQSGILSDLGVLKSGQFLKLSSQPHFGVETAGNWRLGSLTVRVLTP